MVSSSQASVCAGTLAHMAGGVPVKAPMAGICHGTYLEWKLFLQCDEYQGAGGTALETHGL